MAARSSWSSRNPRSISGYKGAVAGFLAYGFLSGWGLSWWFAYAVFLCASYFSPVANASRLILPFSVAVSLPLFSDSVPYGYWAIPTALFLGVAFAVILGVKNLTITHREAWVASVSHALTYLSFLSFFALAPSRGFALLAVFALYAALACVRACGAEFREAFPLVAAQAGVLWSASLLPVGFVGETNIAFAAFLFMHDALHSGAFRASRVASLAAAVALIALVSSWRL